MSGTIRMKIEIDLEGGDRITGEMEYPNDTYGHCEPQKFLERIFGLVGQAKQKAETESENGD